MPGTICEVMRKCYEKGWITTRDGNMSLRRAGSKSLYITPSAAKKNKLEPESMLKLEINELELIVPDGVRPSGELEMHWLLHQHWSKQRAVLHVHPTHIVAAMYAGWDLQLLAAEFPEVNRYTKVGPGVRVLPAVSKELAEETLFAMRGSFFGGNLQYNIVGQARHGVCSVGETTWEAYEHIERLDHVCEIVLKSGVRPYGL